jgi:hypothetical protein
VKVFAVIPALLVLVSLCGDSVPLPGTVIGDVFYDQNRNGIRDSCDTGPPLGRYVTLTGEGDAFRQPAGRDEGFRFDDVPPGEYTLSLDAAPGEFWPLTTVSYGQAGQPVIVEQGEVSEQTLGVALSEPIPFGPRLIGLAYEDADGDGATSRDECGIPGSGVASPEGTYYASNFPRDPAGSFQLTSYKSEFPALTVMPGGLLDSWWQQTSPPPPAGHCASEIAARPRYAEGVFELNVGFRLARGHSSIAGALFLDENGDGRRDENEMVIDGGVSLTPECQGGYGPQLFLPVEDAGNFELSGLPPGDYTLTFAFANSPGLQPVYRDVAVSLTDDDEASVDYPLRRVPTGALIVYVYEDINGNGQFDESLQEPLDTNNPVCYEDITDHDVQCAEPQQVARGMQVPVGTFEVYIPYTDGVQFPQTVEIREGEAAELYFARRES